MVKGDGEAALRAFGAGEDWRRLALEKTWPGLYEALAGIAEPKRPHGCAMHGHGEGKNRTYVQVTGRLWFNGPPACPEHLKASKRPGGYPLEYTDPAIWKE